MISVLLWISLLQICVFFLVRGSPFLTFSVTQPTPLSITTIHAILSFSSNDPLTKHTFNFNNGQTWILYASSPIRLSHGVSDITSEPFSGIIWIALLPDSDLRHEDILDRFSSCYPLCGDVVFAKPFCVEYKWENRGWGDLLLLAHPLHLQLLSENGYNNVTVLNDFKYKSIDGDLVGVVGDSWILKTDPVSVTWHSTKGVKEESHDEIVSVLLRDAEDLNASAIATNSSYFYGKLIARAARLALIAEAVFENRFKYSFSHSASITLTLLACGSLRFIRCWEYHLTSGFLTLSACGLFSPKVWYTLSLLICLWL